jgi:hypothetical protein
MGATYFPSLIALKIINIYQSDTSFIKQLKLQNYNFI